MRKAGLPGVDSSLDCASANALSRGEDGRLRFTTIMKGGTYRVPHASIRLPVKINWEVFIKLQVIGLHPRPINQSLNSLFCLFLQLSR